jgi:RNA polymerase sigma factor for flagellar operon FliA
MPAPRKYDFAGADWSKTDRTIALEYGCSHMTVYDARRRAGAPMAPRQPKTRKAAPLFPLAQRTKALPVPANLLALWREYQLTPTPALRNALAVHYRPTVQYLAERFRLKLPDQVDLDDLVSAGTFGLLDAIEKFDLDRGVKFETYAAPRIRGAILDEMRYMDWVPRLVRARATKLAAATKRLQSALGRDPTDDEVAKQMKVSARELRKIKDDSVAVGVVSLSRKHFETDSNKDVTEGELLADPSPSPASAPDNADAMSRILRGLDPKEQLAVKLYFGEDMRMKEVGRTLGISESRVSQVLSNLMCQFRARFTYDQARELLTA